MSKIILTISVSLLLIIFAISYLSAQKTPVNCQINLNTLKPGDTFRHKLIIIKGSIACQVFNNTYKNKLDSTGRVIKINNSKINSYASKIDANWPISTFHEFKSIALLTQGVNKLQLTYSYLNEKAYLSLNIKMDQSQENKLEPLHLVIFFNKDSRKVFDMDPKTKLTESNGLSSAIKRFQTVARLWQAFNSEQLNLNSQGYKSFRFEEDSYGDPIINLIQSNITLQQYYDLGDANDLDLLSLVKENIRKNKLFKKKTKNNLQVVALLLDAHYDSAAKKLVGHTALGGIGDPISLGVFGSHLTLGWPETFKQLVSRLTDRTPIDRNFIADDSSPFKFKCFNVGTGAMLHEVGHTFGLVHTSGIMGRGFEFLNRAFLSIEPDTNTSNDFIPIRNNEDLGPFSDPIWNSNDTIILSRHTSFSPGFYIILLNYSKFKLNRF